MLQAQKSRYLKNSSIIGFLCPILFLAGCKSDFFSGKEVVQIISEANVWCDYMPGTPPGTHAVMKCSLHNLTDQDIIIKRAEGLIVDAKSTSQLRRFTPVMLVDGSPRTEVRLASKQSTEVVFRTPEKVVMPIDLEIYPNVLFMVRCETNFDQYLIIKTPAMKLTKTE